MHGFRRALEVFDEDVRINQIFLSAHLRPIASATRFTYLRSIFALAARNMDAAVPTFEPFADFEPAVGFAAALAAGFAEALIEPLPEIAPYVPLFFELTFIRLV
jgi:hypothetical protein